MRRSINTASPFRSSIVRLARVVEPLGFGTSRALHVSSKRLMTCMPPRAIYSTPLQSSTRFVKGQSFGLRRFYATDNVKVQVVPPMGDSISEGELKGWSKNVGDPVNVDDLVATIETDKVAIEIRAKDAGVISEQFAEPNSTVKVGSPLFSIAPGPQPSAAATTPMAGAKEPAKATEAPLKEAAAAQPPPPAEAPKAAEAPKPAAEAPKPAAEALKPAAAPPKAAEAPKPAAAAQAAASVSGGERRVKASRMRLRVAERLKDSQNTYALLTTFQEADMFNLMQMREDFKDEFLKKHGVKLGFMSAFVKASAAALAANPIVNAVFDGKDVVYRDYIDISVAVATPRGLVVPVVRNCDKLSFAEIEKTIAALGARARNDEITIEEMTGGTFTISNGGVYGSMMGTPIVNPPQSAILGMHAITNRAVVVGNEIKIRPMMYLALTYDHRLIDGKDAVTFLRQIKFGVEDPRRLLLDL
jgi:2-oxoglutarate dehydrogenase E2 component (dihydrolipoamide succinyltransferase)